MLEGVAAEVVELVVGMLGRRGREIVVNHFPRTVTIARPIIAAVRCVRIVHQKRLRALGIATAGEQGIQASAVDRMAARNGGAGDAENRGKQIHHRGLLALDRTGENRETLLVRIRSGGLGPGGDEGHAHPAFVVRTFLATQRGGAGDRVLVTEGRIGAVVSQEKDQGIFGDAKGLEMVEEIAERLVHTFDERGEGLRVGGFSGIFVVSGETRVRLER